MVYSVISSLFFSRLVKDRITQTLIEAGEQLRGLYFSRGLDSMAVAVAQTQPTILSDLWHHRLGYPAFKTMEMLPLSISSSTGFDSKSCDVCIPATISRFVSFEH